MASRIDLRLQCGGGGGGGGAYNTASYAGLKLMKKFKKGRYVFPGRFGGLTGKPGDFRKNFETPSKTRRVGRSDVVMSTINNYLVSVGNIIVW